MSALLLLLLAPSLATERADCGLVAGERYWITTGGLVLPDGSTLVDWHACRLPEGLILALPWDEAPGYVLEVRPACAPSADEEVQLSALVAKARKALTERGIDAADIPVRRAACSDRRRVDVKRAA